MSATPRYRHPSFWTGRMVRAIAVAVALLAILRYGWGRTSAARVESLWAEARQRGEPSSADEMKLPEVTDATNAWAVQMKAVAAAKPGVDSFRTSNLDGTNYPPYGPKWTKLAEGSEAVNGGVFVFARQARAFPAARLRDQIDPNPLALWSVSLGSARQLANLVADGAQLMEIRGHHTEAVERLRDLMHLGRSLRQDPYLISQLVGIGIDALTCESAQIIAPGLKLGRGDPDSAKARAAVKGLIADLLDERNMATSLRDSFYIERLSIAYMLNSEAEQRRVIRPLADGQIVRSNQNTALAIEATMTPDLPAARVILDRMSDEENHNYLRGGLFTGSPRHIQVPRYSHWFAWASPPSFQKCIERHFQALSERRMTAVILAAQFFRADHNRWPEKLEELVPAYLSAVPRDPYRSPAAPIGYVILRKALPDGSDRPLVYTEPTVYDDQDPDHWRSPIYGWQRSMLNSSKRRGEDIRQYRDLTRFRFADVPIKETGGITPLPGGGYSGAGSEPEPSADGVDNNPDKPNAPGQDPQKQPKPN